MDANTQTTMIDVFKNDYLRKEANSVSIATLLSERYLKRIKYDPYYQRNYVWEKDKQSFFIESIFMGTEIPPIVLFKSGTQIEVIDGRQRFETIKRYKEDGFALHTSGLLKLKGLEGRKYSDLKPAFQQLFDDTKIRIFEFSIVGLAELNPSIEDQVKKEIFRRYNSGITPLNQAEIDNAKYDDDNLTDSFRLELKNSETYRIIKTCFFPASTKLEKDLAVEMVAELRKLLVLKNIPITKYADSGKTLLIEMLYDNFIEELQEGGVPVEDVEKELIDDIVSLQRLLPSANANIYECLIWAISILKQEHETVDFESKKQEIIAHYNENRNVYETDSDHYYGNIMARFQDTADFIGSLCNFKFDSYLRDSSFGKRIKELKQTETDVELTMEKLSSLRISKPTPSSKPIDQLLREVESNKYLIRPSYQRQEKINVYKASSIIESILLGIKLPPLFVYVRNDGIREVIDGQQRLLTIIGFLGKKYKNEENEIVTSINHCFSLKGLRILKEYNGLTYSKIREKVEDTILDFNIDEIEIRQDINSEFEPTDLFIRLNSKPYPIRPNTFEMWNSFADKDILEKVKEITRKNIDWFYIVAQKTDSVGTPIDRMQNEELTTILSYLCYNNHQTGDIDKALGFYPRLKKFTCRLKTKSALTNVLDNINFKPTEKNLFLKSIERTEEIISIIKDILFEGNATKDSLNDIFNVKNLNIFKRSYQEFYILWIFLMDSDPEKVKSQKEELKIDFNTIFKLQKNIDDQEVDDSYIKNFLDKLSELKVKYEESFTQGKL